MNLYEENLLSAIKQNGETEFEDAPYELRDNKSFVLEVVKICGYALEYASDELKDDADVVYAAVCNEGCALAYASERLQANKKIVLAAVKDNGHAFTYAAVELIIDKAFLLKAANLSEKVFADLPNEILEEIETDKCKIEDFKNGIIKFSALPIELFMYDYYVKLIKEAMEERLNVKFEGAELEKKLLKGFKLIDKIHKDNLNCVVKRK